MKEQTIIAFVGMPGAGKSFCVDYLVDKGIPQVYLGGITVEEVKRRGMEVNEANEKLIREELRAIEGPGVMATRILTKIDELFAAGHSIVVADGIYSWTEYKIFKERFGQNVIIIAVTAPRKIRHERLSKRPIRPLTDKQVTLREYAEIENIEKGGPIANADYTIVNNSTPEQMLKDIDAVLIDAGITAAL